MKTPYPGLLNRIAREHKTTVTRLTAAEKEACVKKAHDQMLVMHMLMCANDKCFGSAIKDKKNMYLMNRNNQYPKTLYVCFMLLQGWTKCQNVIHNAPNNAGAVFTKVRVMVWIAW
jgi:hypothetical protein